MSQATETVEVRDAATAAEARAVVAAREEETGAPALDEAGGEALDAAASGDRPREGWEGMLLRVGGEARAYADLRRSDGAADLVALDTAAAAALAREVAAGAADDLLVWLRAAGDDEVRALGEIGLKPRRRLLVMRRPLELPIPSPDLPGGVDLRTYEPEDEQEIVDLLREAYAGTPDGGWDLDAFRRRTSSAWFRAEDLVVAEGRPGDVAGIHWTKRRSASEGEVYNLAVSADARGLGLGRALLREGLRHLAEVGCDDVILWVDEANADAVALYRSDGFVPAWTDVALARQGE